MEYRCQLGLVRAILRPDRLMETIQLSGDVYVHRLDAMAPNCAVNSTADIDPNQRPWRPMTQFTW